MSRDMEMMLALANDQLQQELAELHKERDELKAMVNELRDAIFHAACDLAESDITNDDGLTATHDDLLTASKKTPAQSLHDHDMRVAEKVREACATVIATKVLPAGHGAWTDEAVGLVLDRDKSLERSIRNLDLSDIVKEVNDEKNMGN